MDTHPRAHLSGPFRLCDHPPPRTCGRAPMAVEPPDPDFERINEKGDGGIRIADSTAARYGKSDFPT